MTTRSLPAYGDAATAREWYKETVAARVIKALENNNIAGFYVKTKEEAGAKVMSLIPEGSIVGNGGSVSMEQAGVFAALSKGNYRFTDRSAPGLSREDMHRLRKESLTAQVFLSSTNALTLDGKLVNIDGYGNRVAALGFGTDKVIVLAGFNKIVPDVPAALYRIKNYVCPIHAHRMGLRIPCGEIAECTDCRSKVRICSVTSIIDFQQNKERMTVIICGEELGI